MAFPLVNLQHSHPWNSLTTTCHAHACQNLGPTLAAAVAPSC